MKKFLSDFSDLYITDFKDTEMARNFLVGQI